MAATIPFRQGIATPPRSSSQDPQHDIHIQMDHYIGIDVGTGSARACIIDERGDIKGLASENIGLWQPQQGYYVSFWMKG
jgi:hypothetical protein